MGDRDQDSARPGGASLVRSSGLAGGSSANAAAISQGEQLTREKKAKKAKKEKKSKRGGSGADESGEGSSSGKRRRRRSKWKTEQPRPPPDEGPADLEFPDGTTLTEGELVGAALPPKRASVHVMTAGESFASEPGRRGGGSKKHKKHKKDKKERKWKSRHVEGPPPPPAASAASTKPAVSTAGVGNEPVAGDEARGRRSARPAARALRAFLSTMRRAGKREKLATASGPGEGAAAEEEEEAAPCMPTIPAASPATASSSRVPAEAEERRKPVKVKKDKKDKRSRKAARERGAGVGTPDSSGDERGGTAVAPGEGKPAAAGASVAPDGGFGDDMERLLALAQGSVPSSPPHQTEEVAMPKPAGAHPSGSSDSGQGDAGPRPLPRSPTRARATEDREDASGEDEDLPTSEDSDADGSDLRLGRRGAGSVRGSPQPMRGAEGAPGPVLRTARSTPSPGERSTAAPRPASPVQPSLAASRGAVPLPAAARAGPRQGQGEVRRALGGGVVSAGAGAGAGAGGASEDEDDGALAGTAARDEVADYIREGQTRTAEAWRREGERGSGGAIDSDSSSEGSRGEDGPAARLGPQVGLSESQLRHVDAVAGECLDEAEAEGRLPPEAEWGEEAEEPSARLVRMYRELEDEETLSDDEDVMRAAGKQEKALRKEAVLRWLDGKDMYADGDVRGARRMFSDALDLHPDLVRALLDRAACSYRIALEENKPSFFSYAVKDYNRALRAAPDPVVFTMRGSAFLDLGHPKHAVADFDRALQLRPTFALAAYNRGAAKAQQLRHAEAEADFTLAIDLAARAIHSGRASGGRPTARIVTVLAEALRDRGVARYERDDVPGAVADATRALQLKPDFVDALINRGAALMRGGEPQAAVDDLDRAVRLDPDYALPWNNRGNAFMMLGDVGEALVSYSRALVLDPEHVDAYVNRAQAAASAGDAAQAIADYTSAIERQPDNHMLHNRRGSVYEDAGELDKAQEDYMKAVEMIS